MSPQDLFLSRSRVAGWFLRVSGGLLLPGLLLLLGGCQEQEQVRHYTVAKPPPAVAPTKPEDDVDDLIQFGGRGRMPPGNAGRGSAELVPTRIVAFIVPQEKETWFFKLTGPRDSVTEQLEPLLSFSRSLRFDADGTPKWTLPEGWIAKPGNQFRFATLAIGSKSGPLEMSISALPSPEGDFNEYLLSNVNRWREQVQAPKLLPEQLGETMQKFDIGEFEAWFVLIDGRAPGGGVARGPAVANRDGAAPPAVAAALPFECEIPVGWIRKAAGAMRVAEFEAHHGERNVTISVSRAGGDLTGNVNRWREQVGLAPLGEAEVVRSVRELEVGKLMADYVELVGPAEATKRQTILGAIVQAQGAQWFFKLMGDAELAKDEQPRFEAFVQSIRFRGAEGKNDGQ